MLLQYHALERYLENFPLGLRDIVWELHNIVASAAPDADEEIKGNMLTYYYKERGGPVSAGICRVLILADHVRLAFIHGAFLPDPGKRLQGKTYPMRYMMITTYDKAPWEDIAALIKASSRFDPRTLSMRDEPGPVDR
jgi:hypothetical protein